MKAVSWRLSFHSHGGGGGGGGGGIVQTFPLLQDQFRRSAGILIVKANSKRASSKKRDENRQDKSLPASSSVAKEIKENRFEKRVDFADDSPLSSYRNVVDSEMEVVSSEHTTNASLLKREVVLKACVTTSAAILVIGVLLQQATHIAAESGWSVPDCTLLLKFNVESWHLLVSCGLVLVVSISRQLVLLAWPEFLESSDTANEEVLGPLQLPDYLVVAILPGLSEELLFRGALLPLCGLDWKGITITGFLFGILHLTGGRKNAFAIWASFVGVLYGLACVATTSVLVPMVAHSANNLIGAMIWRLKQKGNSPHI